MDGVPDGLRRLAGGTDISDEPRLRNAHSEYVFSSGWRLGSAGLDESGATVQVLRDQRNARPHARTPAWLGLASLADARGKTATRWHATIELHGCLAQVLQIVQVNDLAKEAWLAVIAALDCATPARSRRFALGTVCLAVRCGDVVAPRMTIGDLNSPLPTDRSHEYRDLDVTFHLCFLFLQRSWPSLLARRL